jgi:hypothetical protein
MFQGIKDECDETHPQKVSLSNQQAQAQATASDKRQTIAHKTIALKTATMSSGYGIRGGIGRCYPFFADLKECLVSIHIA